MTNWDTCDESDEVWSKERSIAQLGVVTRKGFGPSVVVDICAQIVEVMSLCRYIAPARSIRVGTVERIVCGFQLSLIMRAFSVATMCIPTCCLVA